MRGERNIQERRSNLSEGLTDAKRQEENKMQNIKLAQDFAKAINRRSLM